MFAEDGAECADEILNHEARDARAGVDRRQDEQRLEQNGEVIPEGHRRRAADGARQDLRHADGERRRAAGARQNGLFADLRRRRRASVSGVTAKPQEEIAAAAESGVAPIMAGALFIAK